MITVKTRRGDLLDDVVVTVSGLAAGDVVVTQAAFLIDSQTQLGAYGSHAGHGSGKSGSGSSSQQTAPAATPQPSQPSRPGSTAPSGSHSGH